MTIAAICNGNGVLGAQKHLSSYCVCERNWVGKRCEKQQFCSGHGVYHPEKIGDALYPECRCNSGWAGSNCDSRGRLICAHMPILGITHTLLYTRVLIRIGLWHVGMQPALWLCTDVICEKHSQRGKQSWLIEKTPSGKYSDTLKPMVQRGAYNTNSSVDSTPWRNYCVFTKMIN